MTGADVIARLRDYFLLEGAERREGTLDDDARTRLSRDYALAKQRNSASEILWESGAPADALRLAGEAFTLLDALVEVAGAKAPKSREDLRAAAAGTPTLDSALTPAHKASFHPLHAANRALLHELASVAVGPRGRARARYERIATPILLAALVIGTALWWRFHPRVIATASETWGGKYVPENAVDRSEISHWLLPDGRTGWLDIEIKPPRRVGSIAILNAYEPSSYATVDYRLEARLGERVVKFMDGALPPRGTGKPPWVEIPFPTTGKVDHVRIYVNSFKGVGGGFAEVAIR